MGGGAKTLVRQLKTAVFLQKSPKPGGSQSVNQFPFALIFVRIDQNYLFFTRMFKILSSIVLLG